MEGTEIWISQGLPGAATPEHIINVRSKGFLGQVPVTGRDFRGCPGTSVWPSV